MSAGPRTIAGSDGAAGVEFGRAHAELLRDSEIQFELPAAPLPEPPEGGREIRQLPDVDLSFPAGGAAGPMAQGLFWVVIGLAAAGLLYLILTRVAGWQRGEREGRDPDGGDWHMEAEPARQLLGDADKLAAEGRYSEAAHLLLYRSIEEIDRRRPATVRRALTSRDIAGLPAIPAEPRSAFGAIVRAVERSLFAARPLGLSDWEECRSAYQRFAFAGAWQR